MAADSVTVTSPSWTTGTLPIGFRARISGAFWAPFMMSTKRSS